MFPGGPGFAGGRTFPGGRIVPGGCFVPGRWLAPTGDRTAARVRVCDAEVVHLEHVLAEPRGRHRHELDGVAHRGLGGDERIGRIDPELRLRGARRRPASQPGELLAHEVLPLGLDRGGLPVPLDALEDVGGVPALEGVDRRVVDLPGHRRDLVEEPPVVGDDEERALAGRPAAADVLGEPADTGDVEVVRRLVEHDDVPLPGEQAGERHAATLSAGQLAHRGTEVDVAQQPGHDVADRRLRGPFVLLRVADDGGPHIERRVEDVGLLEVAHPGAAARRHASGVRVEHAGEDPHERRLAVAVAADDPDPVAGADPQRHLIEDRAIGVRQAHGLAAEQVHGTPSVGAPQA